MLKKLILILIATAFFACQLFAQPVAALELSEQDRTVKLNQQGEEVVISVPKVQKGKRLFDDTCAQCHTRGITKTNPNVTLSQQALAGAIPPRDNLEGIVDYLKNPTTYDGATDIKELHPNINRPDLYPEMRNLTEDDLEAIAAHILIQPKLLRERWGTGKPGF